MYMYIDITILLSILPYLYIPLPLSSLPPSQILNHGYPEAPK